MKRFMSCIITLFLLPLNYSAIHAEDNVDLKEIASSLGADTDYLNLINYPRDEEHPVSRSDFEEYEKNCSKYEWFNSLTNFSSGVSNGACLGISLIEILGHNNVISPSDIKPDAKVMKDITYSKEIDHFITCYSALQAYFELGTYRKYLISSFSRQEQAQKLIDMAEKCMAEKKYFLIMADNLKDFNHAIVGIGIADGKWEFNDVEYDKCILTLDSNIKSKETDLPMPFHEKGCIYINSETLEFYMPAYDLGSEKDGLTLVSIDDTALMSYKAPLSPSKELSSDITELNSLKINSRDSLNTTVEITDNVGNVYNLEKPKIIIPNINKHTEHYVMGRKLKIKAEGIDEDKGSLNIKLQNQRLYLNAFCYNSAEYELNETDYQITVIEPTEKVECGFMFFLNNENAPCPSVSRFLISNNTMTGFKVTELNDGLLLSSDSEMLCHVRTEEGQYANLDNYIVTEKYFTSVGKILLKYNTDDKLLFYIDPDDDGVFDTAVQKGDVNSDGIIDARDATSVLSYYAKVSAGIKEQCYLNSDFADYDNNDIVDARDATGILTAYAKESVSTS